MILIVPSPTAGRLPGGLIAAAVLGTVHAAFSFYWAGAGRC
ncbi:MAG: hypothetical protein WBG57_06785 [Ornithinimicrobium sp.]